LQGYSDNGIYVTEILSDSAASRAGELGFGNNFYDTLPFTCCSLAELQNTNIACLNLELQKF
jgi:hypothetical protein